MVCLVAYESIFGNTRAVAEAIGEGLRPLGEVAVMPVGQAHGELADSADLLVAGGPTHVHGMTTAMSRKGAVQEAAKEKQPVEPGAADGPGLREWLAERSGDGRPAAAFDTRIDRSPVLTGAASRGIAKRLRRRGYELAAGPESFFVEDTEGPLADGELERAREWGARLARELAR